MCYDTRIIKGGRIMKVKVARVKVNQPSTLQPYHSLHGKIGIAVFDNSYKGEVKIYFTEGVNVSQHIDKNALEILFS